MNCLVCGKEHLEREHRHQWPLIKAIQVARWPWTDDVIFWTWRDQQHAHFARIGRERNTKRLILAAVALSLLTLAAWVTL